MRVLSVNISLPREIEFRGQKVKTSIFKMPVNRRVMARRPVSDRLIEEGEIGVGDPIQKLSSGAGGYLTGTIAALKALGVAEGRIRLESFGQQGQIGSNGKVPHLPAENDGTGSGIFAGAAGSGWGRECIDLLFKACVGCCVGSLKEGMIIYI